MVFREIFIMLCVMAIPVFGIKKGIEFFSTYHDSSNLVLVIAVWAACSIPAKICFHLEAKLNHQEDTTLPLHYIALVGGLALLVSFFSLVVAICTCRSDLNKA
jgi:hypothetical protein